MDEHAALSGEQEPTTDGLALINQLQNGHQQIQSELRKVIIGQQEVVDQIFIALFAGGHCLLTGVPGLAKTRLIHTLAQILELQFKRIQFTPDLMPADIIGTDIIEEDRTTGHRTLKFIKGPIFANILLADEINRTPPKTQSALLEAMQEHRVTTGGETYLLPEPFFVLATQNPIELEGTYPLPEAQLDRFMFNINIDYLPEDEEVLVVTSTTKVEQVQINKILSGEDMLAFQKVVRQVPVAEEVVRYAVRLVAHSRPGLNGSPDFVDQWVNWGAGLRASQYLILGGKARALLQGRYHVSCNDIKALAQPVMRHRILTNFYAEAEKITSAEIITKLLDLVPEPKSGL